MSADSPDGEVERAGALAGDEDEMVGVTRILEYYGPKKWLATVMANCRIPLNGTVRFDKVAAGAYIKAGMVMWGGVPGDGEEAAPTQPIVFPRPGGRPA